MACFRKSQLVRLGFLGLFAPYLLFPQQAIPAASDQANSAMQASIARQMASIAAAASAANQGALKAQQHSTRTQIAAAAVITHPAEIAHETPKTDGATDKPAGSSVDASRPETVEPDAGAEDSSSFFSSPWPKPDGFEMPNVQLQTDACDALPEVEVSQLVNTASSKHAVAADLIRAVMRQESGFRPCAQSTAGAMGLMQLMPETASDLGLSDPFDPAANVDAGTRYLKQMLTRYNGDTTLALSAYNAGPARVDKTGTVPPIAETMDYVSRILSSLPGF